LGAFAKREVTVDTSRKTITFAKWLGRPAGGLRFSFAPAIVFRLT
jgi:hypothetical protein